MIRRLNNHIPAGRYVPKTKQLNDSLGLVGRYSEEFSTLSNAMIIERFVDRALNSIGILYLGSIKALKR